MDRIHHPSAIATPPDVDAHATPGYPTEGNPGGGIEATIMTAWIGHSIIEEIRNVIVGAGMTPAKSTLSQLHEAVARLAVGRAQKFDSAGTHTFTVPAGVYRIKVTVTGGGGGGAGSPAGNAGGGGGAGGTAIKWIDVVPGQTISVTNGVGGAGGASGGGNGGDGTSSSFGSFCSATGGTGGTLSTGQGGGGSGVGGDINLTGGDGDLGSSTYSSSPGGSGGASYWGGGGRGGSGLSTGGLVGKAPGSGGGGCAVAAGTGGAGAPGFVLVEYA